MKRYVLTWAQNDTPVCAPFLAALRNYPAKLVVIRGHYHNPTSKYEAFLEDKSSWAPVLEPFMLDGELSLCPNLKVLGNIRTQPTAARPLSGLEAYVGKNSAIVGHPKRAFTTVATTTRWPRVLATTGAVTVPNYSRSTAGAKGERHHVLGALVVEVDTDGAYFIRQISWDAKTKTFTDLATTYSPAGMAKARPALSLTVGDVHAGRTDAMSLAATHEQITELAPEHVFLHDVFDCSTRNHHERKNPRDRYEKRNRLVRDEVRLAAGVVADFARRPTKVHVVRSNHDEALDKWLAEHEPEKDPANTPYWHRLWAKVYSRFEATGKWPMAFPLECSTLGTGVDDRDWPFLRKVHFLARDESVMLGDVEHGFHGHSGIGGSRGTTLGYTKLGAKITKGHEHAPVIHDGVYGVGHISDDDHGYNHLPSGWSRANCVQYRDGKRSLLHIVRGRWHGETPRSSK